MNKSVMNVPNILSLVRCALVPVFVASLLFMTDLGIWGCVVPAVIYAITAFTDMLDGKIARKYGLVTDFGKFIDPIADKFMVIGALFVLLIKFKNLEVLLLVTLITVVFRELAITSIRLVASNEFCL